MESGGEWIEGEGKTQGRGRRGGEKEDQDEPTREEEGEGVERGGRSSRSIFLLRSIAHTSGAKGGWGGEPKKKKIGGTRSRPEKERGVEGREGEKASSPSPPLSNRPSLTPPDDHPFQISRKRKRIGSGGAARGRREGGAELVKEKEGGIGKRREAEGQPSSFSAFSPALFCCSNSRLR